MKSRYVLAMFFVLCTAVFSLLSAPLTAQAAPGDQWARWFVEVVFDDTQPLARMTIEVGHETRFGNLQIDISETYPLECEENGSLHISGNVASFDGSGYLECEMPNFQEKVYSLSGGEVEIADSCICKRADGLVNFTFDSAVSQNPFFYMPDLQFSAPTNAYGSMIQYQLLVSGEIAESEPFMNTGQMQFGGGAFVQSGNGYAPEFEVGGLELGSNPEYIPVTLEVPTNQTKFFIGFNPDTGEFLQGKLGYLYMDPGCVGHGGI